MLPSVSSRLRLWTRPYKERSPLSISHPLMIRWKLAALGLAVIGLGLLNIVMLKQYSNRNTEVKVALEQAERPAEPEFLSPSPRVSLGAVFIAFLGTIFIAALFSESADH